MPLDLTQEKALIFRIVHKANVDWLLSNGVHCPASSVSSPSYVSIGNPDLIERRSTRNLPDPPGGSLAAYAPLYFTPCSPMLYNIKTGWGGIRVRRNNEIIILISSLHTLQQRGIPFVFSDRHAFLAAARFSSNLEDLSWIDWPRLQAKNFKRDLDDPERFERYQAEALVKGSLPVEALMGIGCYDEATRTEVDALIATHGLEVKIVTRPGWYF